MKGCLSLPRFLSLTLPIAIAVFAIALRLNAGARTIDDSFITYRYARNILAGNGFVFNPGEPVLGTTTPLYTLALVLLAIPFGGVQANFPIISYVFNALIDGATCLLLYKMGKTFYGSLLGIATSLAFALAPYSVTFSIGGLETSLIVLLLVAMSYAYLMDRVEWAAGLAALAFLTRPDALILIFPLLIDFLFRTYRAIKAEHASGREKAIQRFSSVALIFSVPCAIWLIFAYFYFGSLFPNSIAAKSIAYRLPENSALIRLLQHYATPFFEETTFGNWGIAVGLVLYPSLACFGAMRCIRRNHRSVAIVLFPWLYFLVFAIANPLIFRWYLTPPIPFYFLTIFTGSLMLLEQFFHKLAPKAPALGRWFFGFQVLFAIILPTVLILRAWQLHPDHGQDRLAPQMAFIQLELHYEEAARFLKSNSPIPLSQTTIAAGDVGVLGYRTNARILDTVGLNSPQSLAYYPLDPEKYVINYAIPTQLIMDTLPDYLVILEVYGRKTLLLDEDFNSTYRLIHKIDTDIYESNGMLIFQKRK
jgi:hypothetical protein